MPTPVRVAPVRGRQDLHRFLRVPWEIYRHDPHWVPPLLFDQKQLLNRQKHPFHQHAKVEYFLAWHGDTVVGRIAAIVNHQYVQFHEEATGFLGFFECVNDREVARLLFSAAELWVQARGIQRVRGPMSFSTNEECALLVEGFDSAPTVMMPYNPPYYGQLFVDNGYTKAKDLLAYLLDDTTPPERLVRGVERLVRGQNVIIRPFNRKQFKHEVEIVSAIYRSAWERNWGFVPMTEAEISHFADQMWWVANPHLCLFAEVDREPVGFALALPDYNQVLRHLDGKLFPFGLLKFLWYRRKINTARVLILGLKPGFRRRGLDAMLYLRLWQEAPRNGYPIVECSWILEDNWDMRRALERMGARLSKTYRIYEKDLET
ncbi:MAG: N-acetyltransferase family protein [Candidatus Binatia bacterium]